MISQELVPLTIAIVPPLALAAYMAAKDRTAALGFLVGSMGWFAALLIRAPALTIPILLHGLGTMRSSWYPVYTATISGFFEEPIRYGAFRLAGFTRKSMGRAISLGSGWAFAEAIIVFAIPLVAMDPPLNALPGGVERFSAMLAHISFTLMVLASMERPWLLAIPILLHSALNLSALASIRGGWGAWNIEALILMESTALLTITYLVIVRKVGRRFWS